MGTGGVRAELVRGGGRIARSAGEEGRGADGAGEEWEKARLDWSMQVDD